MKTKHNHTADISYIFASGCDACQEELSGLHIAARPEAITKHLEKYLPMKLTFTEYQYKSLLSAIYPNKGSGDLAYPALGLAGETGEVCEKIKKIIRDHKGILSVDVRHDLLKELGDVLWYVTALAMELKSDLETVAKMNMSKLESRRERGTISGSGDNR